MFSKIVGLATLIVITFPVSAWGSTTQTSVIAGMGAILNDSVRNGEDQHIAKEQNDCFMPLVQYQAAVAMYDGTAELLLLVEKADAALKLCSETTK